MAQLVEWSLPTQLSSVRIQSSAKKYIERLLSTILKRRKSRNKRPGMVHLKKSPKLTCGSFRFIFIFLLYSFLEENFRLFRICRIGKTFRIKKLVISHNIQRCKTGGAGGRVTRFGEISPIWQNFKYIWQSFEGSFSNWQNFNLYLEIFLLLDKFFNVVNSQILNK